MIILSLILDSSCLISCCAYQASHHTSYIIPYKEILPNPLTHQHYSAHVPIATYDQPRTFCPFTSIPGGLNIHLDSNPFSSPSTSPVCHLTDCTLATFQIQPLAAFKSITLSHYHTFQHSHQTHKGSSLQISRIFY